MEELYNGYPNQQPVPLNTKIKIRYGTNEFLAYAISISVNGINFYAPKHSLKLMPDDIIEVFFSFPDSNYYTQYSAKGEISNFTANTFDQNGNLVNSYGIKFLEISPDSLAAITNYCQQNISENTNSVPVPINDQNLSQLPKTAPEQPESFSEIKPTPEPRQPIASETAEPQTNLKADSFVKSEENSVDPAQRAALEVEEKATSKVIQNNVNPLPQAPAAQTEPLGATPAPNQATVKGAPGQSLSQEKIDDLIKILTNGSAPGETNNPENIVNSETTPVSAEDNPEFDEKRKSLLISASEFDNLQLASSNEATGSQEENTDIPSFYQELPNDPTIKSVSENAVPLNEPKSISTEPKTNENQLAPDFSAPQVPVNFPEGNKLPGNEAPPNYAFSNNISSTNVDLSNILDPEQYFTPSKNPEQAPTLNDAPGGTSNTPPANNMAPFIPGQEFGAPDLTTPNEPFVAPNSNPSNSVQNTNFEAANHQDPQQNPTPFIPNQGFGTPDLFAPNQQQFTGPNQGLNIQEPQQNPTPFIPNQGFGTPDLFAPNQQQQFTEPNSNPTNSPQIPNLEAFHQPPIDPGNPVPNIQDSRQNSIPLSPNQGLGIPELFTPNQQYGEPTSNIPVNPPQNPNMGAFHQPPVEPNPVLNTVDPSPVTMKNANKEASPSLQTETALETNNLDNNLSNNFDEPSSDTEKSTTMSGILSFLSNPIKFLRNSDKNSKQTAASEDSTLIDKVFGYKNANTTAESTKQNHFDHDSKMANPATSNGEANPFNHSGESTLVNFNPKVIPKNSVDLTVEKTKYKESETRSVTNNLPETKSISATNPKLGLNETNSDKYKPDHVVSKSSSGVSMDQEMIDRIVHALRTNNSTSNTNHGQNKEPITKNEPIAEEAPPLPKQAEAIKTTTNKIEPPVNEPKTLPKTSNNVITVKITLRTGKTVSGEVENLNFGGFMVRLPERIPIECQVKLDMSCEDLVISNLQGNCTNSDQIDNAHKEFLTGICFGNLDSLHFQQLRALIYRFRKV